MTIKSINKSTIRGFLTCNEGGIMGIGGMGSYANYDGKKIGYHPGWPSGGTLEPDVTAQWLFDEAAGNVVDEVASLAVAKSGSPTYSQPGSGLWWSFNGILVSAGNYFTNASSAAAVEPGVGNFTVELTIQFVSAGWSGGVPIFYTTGATGGLNMYMNSNKQVGLYAKYADASTDTVYFTGAASIVDDSTHHMRTYCTRDAANGMGCEVDGAAFGGTATGFTSAKSINSSAISLGYWAYGSAIYREARFSKNATNNSFGL